ncbi:MAG: iron ABC transporter permease [Paracoccus sp. (in: a-proteobacteria)]|uniref:FecCD family ABC transporter permease n=1 Tax=Paracoccus sp. TaxID=267 RepID=UPI0026DFC4C9|nr:iron ABC transporter permease [Paracoccus sp. (in: a-proteobacteria)]MDO5611870.1 iron ABC transporter permease [Paracoccus sp. (in: a-proteobacteria)]
MPRFPLIWLVILCAGLVLLSLWSLTAGASDISPGRAMQALWSPGNDRADIIVQGVRLPRLIAALAAGAALAVAGAIMQAVTGNPLADPGLLGINSGAAFAVVTAISLTGTDAGGALMWAAFAGAGAAAALVYALGATGRSGPTPLKLVLAGVVVSTFLGAVTAAVLILDQMTLDVVRLWTAGSLRNRTMAQVMPVLPWLLLALLAALILRAQFTTLSLGAETARMLGQNPARWRAVAGLLVVALAGGAVAIAGPLGFVGLVVPHLARLCLGPDYRLILPFAAVGGAGLAALADTMPRALWGTDVPLGVSMALIGAPFFIWLARSRIGAAA